MLHRVFLPLLGALSVFALPHFEGRCSLSSIVLSNIPYPFDVNFVAYLPPNGTIDYVAEGVNATCRGDGSAPFAYPMPMGVCRLSLRVETTIQSEIYMEIWLPEQWNGRVLTVGNGGLAGCIQYPELAFGAQYGFASIGTNNGHNGTSGGAFFHQPDVLEDFAGRAILAGTQVGKSITKQFYGADLGRSYYLGCSTGGRQGFRAVQKYPELFDGVVAGAPVLKQWGHAAYFGYVKQVLGLNSSSITPAQWSAVQSEVFRQCDDLDGAKDGILENPDSCTLDWTPLLCKYNDTAVCFTDSQAVTAAKLFEPMIYNGTFLGPSQNHGFEPLMIASLYSPLVSSWVPEIMRYMVYEDLSWDPATFTLQDILKGIEKDNFDLSTFEGNISAFRDRGGKVLHWHGGADQLITMRTSNLYYETVRSALNASVAELDQFYRYFRASGVNHCSGGPGASFMGQIGGTVGGVDPADNLLLSIVQWVELGIAPEYIRGTKFINDTRSLGVQYRRKHCKYPKTNKYTANGDGFDEEGWQCVEP